MSAKIVVIESDELARLGLTAVLNQDPNIEVLAACDGRNALELAKRLAPDLVLMEILLPTFAGVPLLRALVRECPAAKTLVLTRAREAFLAHLALQIGAAGYFFKSVTAQQLRAGIHQAIRGERALDPQVPPLLESLFARPEPRVMRRSSPVRRLSPQETTVLCMIASSYGNYQIAGDLAISVKTVEKHRQRVMDKLNLHSISALTRFAVSAGLIDARFGV